MKSRVVLYTYQTSLLQIVMITGDKQETAINIATSCRLIGKLEHLLVCNAPFSTEEAQAKLEELTQALEYPESHQFQAGQPPQVSTTSALSLISPAFENEDERVIITLTCRNFTDYQYATASMELP